MAMYTDAFFKGNKCALVAVIAEELNGVNPSQKNPFLQSYKHGNTTRRLCTQCAL